MVSPGGHRIHQHPAITRFDERTNAQLEIGFEGRSLFIRAVSIEPDDMKHQSQKESQIFLRLRAVPQGVPAVGAINEAHEAHAGVANHQLLTAVRAFSRQLLSSNFFETHLALSFRMLLTFNPDVTQPFLILVYFNFDFV